MESGADPSTAGVGASTIEANYPSRLEAELRARIPGAVFHVINHGVSGDEARQMLTRFEADVLHGNKKMLRVFERTGLPVVTKSSSECIHVTLFLNKGETS